MINIDVRADIRQAERFYTNLRRHAVKMAAARAINDTLITLRAEGSRMIKRDHPALRIGDIKNNMTMKRAHKFNLRGMVATRGGPLSMLLFRVGGGEVNRRRLGPRGQVSFAMRRTFRPVTAVIGQKRAVMQMKGRKAFRIKAYGNEVFVRTHDKGRGVRKLRGPSMSGVFRAKSTEMKSLAEMRWRKAFASRMQYEINLAKGAVR